MYSFLFWILSKASLALAVQVHVLQNNDNDERERPVDNNAGEVGDGDADIDGAEEDRPARNDARRGSHRSKQKEHKLAAK